MPTSTDTDRKPNPEAPETRPPVPGGAEADFGEKGAPVRDRQAGLSEEEKLEEAVEDLSAEKG